MVDIGTHQAWVPLVIKLASARSVPMETGLNSLILSTWGNKAGRTIHCALLRIISATLFWKLIFTIMATTRAGPTGKTKRKIIKAFLSLCAALSVRDQAAVLDQCFPCRAYYACLALRFIVFFLVCFTQLARDAMNGCPVFYWCTTWHRNLWSHGTVRKIYAFVFFSELCHSSVSVLVCTESLLRNGRSIRENEKKHIHMDKSIAVIVFKVGTRWPKSHQSRKSLNRIHLSMLWNCCNPAECNWMYSRNNQPTVTVFYETNLAA